MMPRTKGVESLWCASCASLSRACGCVAGREGPWNGTRSPTGGAESRDRSTFDDGAQLRMTALAWKARSGAHNSDQLSNDRYRIRLSNRSNPTLVPCDPLARALFIIVCLSYVSFVNLFNPPWLMRSEPERMKIEIAVVTAVPLDRRRAVWAGTWASFLMPHWSAGPLVSLTPSFSE
jgi:hypothetical protein